MILVYTVLIGLASYRLWRISAEDIITRRPRNWLYDQQGPVGVFLSDLVGCIWCLGFWYSGALAGLVACQSEASPTDFGLMWLAGSTIAGVIRVGADRLD